ncbi:hypothetical protein HPB50_009434 [Hyalomma asiaticum]|uniref:Uncharacterized protein n=1 Tax=Hyalomma asiaticum TaxID=266040 RepID=A0ACB7SAB3_HYAAI|nr:hypothetical protein HPB50_009434 [Hyalomma asiaticum]
MPLWSAVSDEQSASKERSQPVLSFRCNAVLSIVQVTVQTALERPGVVCLTRANTNQGDAFRQRSSRAVCWCGSEKSTTLQRPVKYSMCDISARMHCLAERRSKIGQTVTGKYADAMRVSDSIAAATARPTFFRFVSFETRAPNLRQTVPKSDAASVRVVRSTPGNQRINARVAVASVSTVRDSAVRRELRSALCIGSRVAAEPPRESTEWDPFWRIKKGDTSEYGSLEDLMGGTSDNQRSQECHECPRCAHSYSSARALRNHSRRYQLDDARAGRRTAEPEAGPSNKVRRTTSPGDGTSSGVNDIDASPPSSSELVPPQSPSLASPSPADSDGSPSGGRSGDDDNDDVTGLLEAQAGALRFLLREPPSQESWDHCEALWVEALALTIAAAWLLQLSGDCDGTSRHVDDCRGVDTLDSTNALSTKKNQGTRQLV